MRKTIQKICKTCNSNFITSTRSKTLYCSGKCNPNVGGLRKGSGRGKSGYYKGIWCDSTYELVWVIYRLDHNLIVERFKNKIFNDNLTYFPDFIENNTIYEIKGFLTQEVFDKKKLAESFGYIVEILLFEDLKKEFDWVKNNYQYSQIEELYDNYKPKYSYICDYCNKNFTTNIKRTKELKYCSNKCSLLGNKKPIDKVELSKIMKDYYKNNPEKTGKGITKKTTTCPHCNKSGSISNMIRWHFKNCKQLK